MDMKKIEKVMLGLVAVWAMVVVTVWAATATGTRLGTGATIDEDVVGGIAIGNSEGHARVAASGAMQIGPGSNNVANTPKYRGYYLVRSTSSGLLSAQTTDIQAAIAGAAIAPSSISTGIGLFTGFLTANGGLCLGVAADRNVTNGQVVAMDLQTVNGLIGMGSTNAATNTITLENAAAAGQVAVIFNKTGATNLIAIATAGNYVGPAIELAAGQSAMLFARNTNIWYSLGNQ
jgi:hypothetical protein